MMFEVAVGRPVFTWRRGTGVRFGCAGAVSAALHIVLALVFMGIVVRPPGESRPIRVFLYDPPPPPPAGTVAGQAPSTAPIQAKPENVVPETAKPAHTAPLRLHRRDPKRTTASKPPPVAPPAESVHEVSPAGEPGGIPGGVAGGVVGGTVGGQGHTLIPAEQAAHLPVAISKVLPEYPPIARMRGIEGQVLLDAIVATDGHIEPDITVVHSVPLLDGAAIAAVRKWLFRPARDTDGVPLRVTLRVPVRFVLR